MPDPVTAQGLIDEATLANDLQGEYHAPPVPDSEHSVLLDVAKQAPIGVGLAVANTGALLFKPVESLLGEDETEITQNPDGSLKIGSKYDLSNKVASPETMAGGMVRGVAQGVTGFLLAGPVAPEIKGAAMVKAALQGFIGDFAAFGAHEDRLSNVIAPLGIPFASAMAGALQSQESDGELIGRLKGAVEGLGIGIATEGAIKVAKGVVMIRRAKAVAPADPTLAKKLLSEAAQDIQQATKSSPVTAPNPELHEAPTVAEAVQAAASAPKDRILKRIQDADPALTFDEASAVADVQHALAKYINPAQDADKTLEGLFDYAPGKNQAVFPAGQEVKGATNFLDDGKAIITLYGKADFSTHVHETAHVVAKYLRPEDKAILDDWVKSSASGSWGKNAQEKFARGLERYLRDGIAPTEATKPMFERIKNFMVNSYRKLRGSSVNVRIPDEVRAVYDKLLTGSEHDKMVKAETKAVVKEISTRAEVKVTQEGAQVLAKSLKEGSAIPEGPALDHLTPALLGAHDRNGTVEIARAVATKVNTANPTGTQSLGRLSELSANLGKSPEAVVAKMREFVQNEKDLSEHIAAFDWHVQALHNEVKRLATEVSKDGATQDTMVEFLKRSNQLEDMVGLQFHSQTILGRSVGAYRLRDGSMDAVREALGNITELHQEAEPLLAAMGGAEKVKKIAKAVAEAKGPAHATAHEVSKLTSAWNKTMEWYMNAILSGPKTHMVNVLSNTMQSVVIPLERAIGGFAVGVFKKDAAAYAEAKQGVLQLMGLTTALKESFNAGIGRFKGKQGIFEGASPAEIKGIRSPFIRKYFLVASRLLESEDEFFKQLNFRATAYARLYERATKEANPEAWLSGQLDNLVKNPEQFKEGVDTAKAATFTEDLQKGTIFHSVNTLVNKHPLLRLIFPFVKTPSNIVRNVGRHVPGLGLLPLVHSDMRAALRAPGGEKIAAQLVGRQIVGLGFTLSAAALWASGKLTGSGPSDPQQRQAWLMAGNREFSVKVGDTWVDYKRLDPFATLIGASADTMAACKELKQPGKAVDLMWKAVMQNVADKTYFKGLSDIVKAVDSPERWGAAWASNVASGFTPYSGATSQLTRSITHTAYRMQGLVDQLKARSLGIWRPEPRINLDGEPIETGMDEGLSPIGITNQLHDPALDELSKVPGGIRIEPSPKIGNVELTPAQVTKLSILQGTLKLGGKTLHESLNSLVESPSYQRLPALDQTPDGYEQQSPRAIQLRKILDRYQAYAKNQLLRDPVVMGNVKQDKQNKMATKAGDFEKIQEIAK